MQESKTTVSKPHAISQKYLEDEFDPSRNVRWQ